MAGVKNSHLSRLGHTRHIRHAGHAPTEPQLTALHTDLSGTLGAWPVLKVLVLRVLNSLP